ncbi:hypothetical protein NQ318_014824 [Aromia moschata]|uniref:Uncharacterized protein n=1 Tax=Aromia moschata TaxID=1265417 RepID=A0AAV8ZCB3_9CUCU|nr:hypothetical protein NQ318_014824 [Aromia moschata]
MRIKHHIRMPTGHLEEDEFVAVKTRSNTPEGAAAGGSGSFWLSAVSAAASAAPHPGHPLEGCNETGFINSQPSMAEFMTALPHLSGEMPHGPPHEPPAHVVRKRLSHGRAARNGVTWCQRTGVSLDEGEENYKKKIASKGRLLDFPNI